MTGEFKHVNRYSAQLRLEVLTKIAREAKQARPGKSSLFDILRTADGRPIFTLPDFGETQTG